MEYSQHTIVTSITFFSTLLINMSFFDLDSLAKREGLKILRITPKYFPKASCPLVVKSSSESHNLAWEITQALAKTNISQTVLTSRLRGGPRQSVSYNHIRVKRIGLLLPKRVAPYLQELRWFLAVAKYLILNRRDYDLVPGLPVLGPELKGLGANPISCRIWLSWDFFINEVYMIC